MNKDDTQRYLYAEEALLTSEGVTAETAYVDLDTLGGRCRVLTVGSGAPMLFVPGVITSGAVFAGLVARLSNFQCVLVERPGTGLTPLLPNQPKDLAGQEAVADDFLVDLMDGLGIDRCHVVTTSLGGWTAFRSVAAHPERFLRVSALGFTGPLEETRHSPELLAKVTAAVHLFWGEDDPFGQQASAQDFADLLPNASLQMVPGAGHAPWIDQPEAAANAIQQHHDTTT